MKYSWNRLNANFRDAVDDVQIADLEIAFGSHCVTFQVFLQLHVIVFLGFEGSE
jgi:hypothetical protein